MKMKQILMIAVGLYVLSAGSSFAAFRFMGGESGAPVEVVETTQGEEIAEEGGLDIDPSEPKDQACPLTGAMYTKTEKDVWSTRRPLAVMIENSPDARPQSGLIRADIVYEAMAEGGVTRFMAIYYCDAVRNDVVLAPVRSARTYYIDWASGYNYPLYVHVGGANVAGPTDALGQLGEYGWVGGNDINQFSVGYPTFKRDYNRIEGKDVATEHTMVSSTEKLWEVGVKRDWTHTNPDGEEWSEGYEGLTFQEGEAGKGDVKTVTFEFWDGFEAYGVKWDYDASSNTYKRTMSGEPHKDLESGKQIEVSNAIVLFSKEKGPINTEKHMIYQTTGTGTAIVFQNGEALEVNWSKPKRESELVFSDKKGKPLELVAGKSWISVVNVGTEIEY